MIITRIRLALLRICVRVLLPRKSRRLVRAALLTDAFQGRMNISGPYPWADEAEQIAAAFYVHPDIES